jgi:hypothetical protein
MMSGESEPSIEYEGVHCSLAIRRPAPGIAVVVLSGSDIGEFQDLPMRELQKDAFVRRFAGLADLMNVFTDGAAFDQSLADSVCQCTQRMIVGGTGRAWRT